jgi:putative NADH-flavin reductase
MRITVFGASGKIGSLVIDEALNRGHEVVAFTHKASNEPNRPGLTIKQGDVHDKQAVDEAMTSAQAVISALGSWGSPTKDILTAGIQNIIEIAKSTQQQYIISLTGSDARAKGDHISFINKLSRSLFMLIAKDVLTDGEQHIRLLEDSQLRWTVVRSPRMNKQGKLYRLSRKRPLPWASVSRKSVANCLVDLLEETNYYAQAPFITRS